MKTRIVNTILIAVISLALISWGGTGHSLISENVYTSFNQEMDLFNSWVSYLVDHASDADIRKSSDPTESPKHYINIDNYYDFIATGRIPQTLDSVINRYGYNSVYDWGILPWATITTYDSLKNSFKRHNFERAKYFAADLSHYVGDGFMPLHITKNFNGQLTNNTGIHSRYESTMINTYKSAITYAGEPITQIQDVRNYIFNYLYYNIKFVDSILLADNYAKTINPNTYSTEYKSALWDKSRSFTIKLFKNASHSLAELIYTAWKEAGSPSLTGINEFSEFAEEAFMLDQNYPNPFSNYTKIKIKIYKPSHVKLLVFNSKGEKVMSLENDRLIEGEYNYEIKVDNIPSGTYFLILRDEKESVSRKMIIIK